MAANLARLAESALDRLGDNPALWFEGTWHTSGELHARAARAAGGLGRLGVRPGDRVVVVMSNCPEVTILYNAIWRAGAVVTPVVFLVSAEELRHILLDAEAAAVATTPELLAKVTAALAGRPVPVILVGAVPAQPVGEAESITGAAEPEGPQITGFAELEGGAPSSIVDRDEADLAALMYTGGTTGRSKGVPLSHGNLVRVGAASNAVSRVPGVTAGITGLPLSHSYGLLVTVGALHHVEQPTMVLQRWFEPRAFLDLAAGHRCQAAAVVPSMLVMLLGLPIEEFDLSNLRFVYCGAAPLAPAVQEEFERRVPGARVLEGYGCTETAGLLTSSPPLAPRKGTVGKPVPGVELRIVGLDGTPARIGEDGEVVVRGPNVMAHYWGAEPSPDGWFHTGDVGRLDPDGYLTIVDRMKDLIIRGGYNVYPRDVEDVLLQHPAVAMAAAVGRPDPRLGEEVVAFVSLHRDGSVTGAELVEFAKARLSATKYPRQVSIVDAVPLTSVGKLDRKRLRAGL
jgi:long-chain acyl-CoA synthetase